GARRGEGRFPETYARGRRRARGLMSLHPDPTLVALFGGVLGFLALATVIGQVLKRATKSEGGRATVANMNARIGAWWVMVAIFAVAVLTGPLGSVVLFGLLSLLALRE